MKMVVFFACVCAFLSGCNHGASDDDTLRTTSVTNNPNLIPARDTHSMGGMPY